MTLTPFLRGLTLYAALPGSSEQITIWIGKSLSPRRFATYISSTTPNPCPAWSRHAGLIHYWLATATALCGEAVPLTRKGSSRVGIRARASGEEGMSPRRSTMSTN